MAATKTAFAARVQRQFDNGQPFLLQGWDLQVYWCSKMESMDSSKDRKRPWFVSLARRNDGDDIELNSCISLVLVTVLSPSK